MTDEKSEDKVPPAAVPPAAGPMVEPIVEPIVAPEQAVAVAPVKPLPGPHDAGPAPVEWQWPSVHPEGYKFAGIAGGAGVLALLFGWGLLGWLLLGLAAFTAAFFRDPKRAPPAGDDFILSPADGLVSQIVEVELPRQLIGEGGLKPGSALRISVFMSVFDVHINRAPIAGKVTRLAYVPGAFVNAVLDKASEENERQYLVFEGHDGRRVAITQIAGLVARRIVGFVREGSIVGSAQRIGLIRFGSRVDIFLPAGFAPQVAKGHRAIAGETILAAVGRDAAASGQRQ
jgi:phosphatidylserine decarboxylase